MRAVQAIFAILFVCLIGVKGGVIPDNSDAHSNENITVANTICRENADCQSVEKCLLEDEAGQGSCVCKAGRSGANCEIVNDCMTENYSQCKDGNGRCSYNDEKETAECDCGVTKKWDNILKICRTICRENADCQSVEKCLLEDEAGQGSCICKAGRSGDNCEIVDDCMTGNYSQCKDGNGRCSYNDEKETAECDCGITKKWDNILKICRITCKDDCANSGVCEDAGDGEKFCRCKEGTRGHLCDIVLDCEPQTIGRMLCGIDTDVKCVYDEIKKGGKCLCDNSTKLFHYDKRKCQAPCKDDCHNSGKCEKVRDYRFCFCKRGTSGDLCERVEDCSRKNFCGTKSNVKCVYDEKKEQAMCKCNDPKKAFDFNVKECRIPCNDDCYNNGKCEYVRGFKFCSCKQGTSGDRCEIMDDCSTNFCGTEPDVKCVHDKTENKTTCRCDDPYKSFDSYTKKCRRSTCSDYFCLNGGSCNDIDSWPPKCYCKVPFTGERCEKGPCTSSPCKNGGTCQVRGNTYNCICRGNFYGKLCEMGPCTDNPCKNGGACQVKGNTYNCICRGNFYGKWCEMQNRFLSPSLLALFALIILVIFILTCNGCFLFKLNQKLNTVLQTYGVYRPSPGVL